MDVTRTEILQKLESANVGVTGRAVLEQSDSFVFSEGQLITFNGEIYTRQKSPMGDEFSGALPAKDFLRILQRFPDNILQISAKGGELIIKGKKRSAGIKMMMEVLLPHQDVPVPEKFSKMPEGLKDILIQASRTCGKDETAPKTTHVHIADDRVEATDSFRVFRAEINTGIKTPVLVHATSLNSISSYDIKGMSATSESWFHFRTADKMTISILCSADKYYKKSMSDSLLQVEGDQIVFPKNLLEILSRAEVMQDSNAYAQVWDSQISIALFEDTLQVTSKKDEGWFKESKRINYSGPELRFSIHPTFLKEIISRTKKAIISEKQIKIEVGNIFFTAALERGDI